MNIKELKQEIKENDFIVEVQYNKRVCYELRNQSNVKKHSITLNQFKYLKSNFDFKYFKSDGFGVRTHYFKQIT